MAFSAFGTTRQKEPEVLRKALRQVRVPHGSRSNFTLQTNPKREQACHQYHQIFCLLQKKSKPNPQQNAPNKSPGKGKSRSHTREPTYLPLHHRSQGKIHLSLEMSLWTYPEHLGHHTSVRERERGKQNEYAKINDVSLSSYIKLIWKGFNFLKG